MYADRGQRQKGFRAARCAVRDACVSSLSHCLHGSVAGLHQPLNFNVDTLAAPTCRHSVQTSASFGEGSARGFRCGSVRDERVLWGPQHALYTVSGPVVLKLKLLCPRFFTAVRHTARYSVGSIDRPRIATGVLRDRGGLGGRAVQTRRA